MPSDARRTAVLEELMAETRVLANSAAFPPDDVRTWFREGSPEYRITAIGLMEGDARVRDLDAVVAAIMAPLSAFEQFHAMVVAESMVTSGSLTNVERTLRGSPPRRRCAVVRWTSHPIASGSVSGS